MMQSLTQIQSKLQSGQLSMKGLVLGFLENIELTRDFNVYVRVFEDEAIARAKEIDQKISSGAPLGKLHGLVVSVKDVICIAEKPVTAASKILEGYKSPFSATVIERLLKEDAIIIGMVNCDEFAMGSSNENSAYGPTRNGHHPEHVPGGSSGASAVSVQLETCQLSLGSDTGGSVRQPAAFCGLYGFKPSYGMLSRYGLIAYASSFDQIGLIGHHIEDIQKTYQCIRGADRNDSTSIDLDSRADQSEHSDSPRRIVHFSNAQSSDVLQTEIHTAFEHKLNQWQSNGLEISEMTFDLLDHVVSTYYILTMAEASSNLSRYDGVRYGYRSEGHDDLEELYGFSRSEGFGMEVKRRIMLGTFVLSSGYYDAYFEAAQRVRARIVHEINEVFEQFDVIALPTVPSTAWKIGEKQDDPVAVYLSDIFTVLANLCGIPSISLPLGKDAKGLDFGIQFMSKRFTDDQLLKWAKSLDT